MNAVVLGNAFNLPTTERQIIELGKSRFVIGTNRILRTFWHAYAPFIDVILINDRMARETEAPLIARWYDIYATVNGRPPLLVYPISPDNRNHCDVSPGRPVVSPPLVETQEGILDWLGQPPTHATANLGLTPLPNPYNVGFSAACFAALFPCERIDIYGCTRNPSRQQGHAYDITRLPPKLRPYRPRPCFDIEHLWTALLDRFKDTMRLWEGPL